MTKEQFIMELEQCLQGEVSAYELSESLTYYRQYFEDEIRNGKSEEQVVEELGSPRLIARSIIDAHGIEESASGNSDYGDNSYGQNDSSYRSYGDAYSDRRDIENNNQKGALQSAGKMIMTIIISALVFFIVLFLLRALLPLAVIIIAAVLIVRLIRG